jgi:hypothetical protein
MKDMLSVTMFTLPTNLFKEARAGIDQRIAVLQNAIRSRTACVRRDPRAPEPKILLDVGS